MSIGCYFSSSTCGNGGMFVFSETLSFSECSTGVAKISGSACYSCVFGSKTYYEIGSRTGMTIEKCLQLCTSNTFSYAGISYNNGYFHLISFLHFEKIYLSKMIFKRFSNCLCGNTLLNPTKTSSTCTEPCSGNSSELCGDSTSYYCSVYSLSNYIKVILGFLIFVKACY